MFAAWSQSDSKQQHWNDKEKHNLLSSSSVACGKLTRHKL